MNEVTEACQSLNYRRRIDVCGEGSVASVGVLATRRIDWAMTV